MAEFIYQMYQARKAHGDKVILDDVTLSFYPGAKIGVVGPNGMGKSTLLKVMAGGRRTPYSRLHGWYSSAGAPARRRGYGNREYPYGICRRAC